MKVSEFMYEMINTSSVFGRDKNVNVTFEGDGAWTDGERINLPSLPLGAELSPELVQIMRGYVDHEAGGHIRHSDMPLIIDKYKRWMNNGKDGLKTLHNCVEDVMIEKKCVETYPGAYKNLKAVNESVKKQEAEFFRDTPEAKAEIDSFSNNAVGAGIKAANPNYLSTSPAAQEVLGMFTEEQQGWLKKWAEMADKCDTTEDCINLAKSIYKHLDPDDSDDKAETPEEFDGQAGADMEDGEPAKGMSDEEALAGLSEAMEKAIKGEIPGGMGSSTGSLKQYKVYTTKNDVVYKRGATYTGPHSRQFRNIVEFSNPKDYELQKNEAGAVIKTLKNKLTRLLLAKLQKDWDFGRIEGRLDSKRLVPAFSGRENVFKKSIDRSELDTAVTILVDLSGSMEGNKIRMASSCVVALSECLNSSGIAFRVAGFTNCHTPLECYDDPPTIKGTFARYESLDTVVFKDFNDTLRKCRGPIGQIKNSASHNNSDYDFICNEIHGLTLRPERRKVLFVLSDGHPACHSDMCMPDHIKWCKQATIEGEKKGIESVGIGIKTSAVEKIYPKAVVVNKLEDLSTTAFKTLGKLLV